MSLTESFERKFLFGLGRHLWNVLGVSGFITLLTGFILLINSTMYETSKTKEDFIGKRKLVTSEKIENTTKELMPFEEWRKSEAIKDKQMLLSLKEWSDEKGIPIPDTTTKKGKALKNEYLQYQDNFINGPATTRWNQYSEYSKSFKDKETALLKKQSQQDNKYENYLNNVSSRNASKRAQGLVSPFVMGYGLAVIASASISSAVLSIERNSRKD